MCDICHCSPCATGCPNAPDPPTVGYCFHCGEPILEGESCYRLEGELYHEDCFEDCAVEILCNLHGATYKEAEKEVIDW